MLLAVETSTLNGSVASLSKEGRLLETVKLKPRDTSGSLGEAVAHLISAHGKPEGYVVDLGPGSFTGLRIGLAFAKGLARGRPRPAVGGSSLETMAVETFEKSDATEVLVVLPASSGGVFAGAFERRDDEAREGEALAVGWYRPAELKGLFQSQPATLDRPWAVTGGEAADEVVALLEPGSWFRVAEVQMPNVAVLGRIGAQRLGAGRSLTLAELEPAYHQLSAAEERARQKALRAQTPSADEGKPAGPSSG